MELNIVRRVYEVRDEWNSVVSKVKRVELNFVRKIYDFAIRI